MRKLNRRGVKALAVLSFMAFTSCAIAGSGAFHLFTPPPAICRCSSTGRAPRPEGDAGSNPAVCASSRVAPGQCETVVVMAHMEMTKLAENCTVGGKRLSVMVLHL